MQNKILSLVLGISLTGCGSQLSSISTENQLIDRQKDDIACEDFTLRFWDRMDSFLVSQDKTPDFESIKNEISKLEEQGDINAQAAQAWTEIYRVLLKLAPQKEKLEKVMDHRSLFVSLEMGDSSTAQAQELKALLQSEFKKLAESQPSKSCAPPEIEEVLGTDDFERRTQGLVTPKAFLGMRWAFATTYQSCSSVRKPALTAASENVKGIIITGTRSDGAKMREIGNLSDLLQTHHYYKGESPAAGCFNFRKSPTIYDYGGKPWATPGNTAPQVLDVLVDAGSGTKVLGIDCSGLIGAAVATAGLKFTSTVPLRARGALVKSTSYMTPDTNGWDCYDFISVGHQGSLQSGDIVAVNGHVLMIGEVGADPLATSNISSRSGCTSINYRNFDFDIWQSDPGKGGIGLNRIRAADYVANSETFKQGFLAYAERACKARFDQKMVKMKLADLRIIRHKGTASCRTARVVMNGESCIKDCPDLF